MSENRPRRGFTLTELLIAIGIIVLLIGLLLPVVSKVRKSAYGASTNSQISNLSLAIQQYYNDFNAYPGPLPLAQIYMKTNTTGTAANMGQSQPFVVDPTSGAAQDLQIIPTGPATGFDPTLITGAQNLTLGLLGGLVVNTTVSPITFSYDPTLIYPGTNTANKNPGNTPGPTGPASLSSSGSHRTAHAYITPQPSDLYNPFDGANLHPFTDAGLRKASDAGIPVFLDKYPDSMPILYMRASRGATGLVALNGQDGNSSPLNNANPPFSAQYDLIEVIGYTTQPGAGPGKGIGTSNPYFHGLQNVWTALSDTCQIHPSNSSNSYHPLDAWAYLRNPDLGPPIPTTPPPPTDVGIPRQKDGFILISAGPDRIYGTTDDITNFGSVAP